MEFIQLKCPNCQANLDAEDTLDVIFCKYCGTRIVLANVDKSVIDAQVKLKLADKQAALEKQRFQQEMEMKKFRSKDGLKTWLIAMGVFLGLMFLFIALKHLTG